MKTSVGATAVLGAVSFLTACSERPLSFGESADYYFWSDHETGDFSDWTERPEPGGFVINDRSSIAVEAGPARSGSHAIRAHGVRADDGRWTTAMVARAQPMPQEAYYSAWFLLPEAVVPSGFWILFLFRSRADESETSTFENEGSLSLSAETGQLQLRLEQAYVARPPLIELPVPIRKWFQIEAFQSITSDGNGRFKVWQDGTLLYDLQGPTASTPYVEWLLGVVVDGLETPPADLYIDDAAITRHQLGPDAGPFTRD